MAVSTTHERVLYDLDGVTAGYSVTFQFFAEGDLSVTYGTTGDETTLSLGSDYTVAARPSDLPALGTITLASPGSLTGKLQIRRSTPRTQGLDLSASGPQDPEAYEDALDRAMLIAQELDQNDPPTGTDFVHGNLGGGALHAVATNSVNGFYAAADKVLNDAHRGATTTVHGITNTATLATIDTAQTFTGQKIISVTGDSKFLKFVATADKHMAAFYRYNNTAGPEWATGSVINSQGAWFTNAWITASGTMAGSPDSEGVYLPLEPTSDPYMIGARSDVVGPSFVSRVAPIGPPTGYHFLGMDTPGTFVFSVEEMGELQWGPTGSTTHASFWDTKLYRSGIGALRTNASLRIDGGTASDGMTLSTDGAAAFLTNSSGGTRAFRFQTYSLVDLSGGLSVYSNGIMEVKDGGRLTTPTPGVTGFNVGVASEKIGFFGATPVVKQTLTGPIGSVPASTSIATALASLGFATNSQVAAYAPLTYSASIDIDASQGTEFVITATNNTNFTINAPTNPATGQRITVRIKNTSGGALGTVTWNAVFKLAAWTSPATANSRAIDFSYDGTNWLEAVRTAADVPN